jgi:hypothetical protein
MRIASLARHQKFVKNLSADNIIKRSIVPTPDPVRYTVPGVERLYLVGPYLKMDSDKVAAATVTQRHA